MKYIENKTQEQRIFDLLNERGPQGAYVYEFTTPRPLGGLGISQYNARIKGLRKKGESQGYSIINTTPGHFVLIFNNHITNQSTKLTPFKSQPEGANLPLPEEFNHLKEEHSYLFK